MILKIVNPYTTECSDAQVMSFATSIRSSKFLAYYWSTRTSQLIGQNNHNPRINVVDVESDAPPLRIDATFYSEVSSAEHAAWFLILGQ